MNYTLFFPYFLLGGYTFFAIQQIIKAKKNINDVNEYWLDSIPSMFTTIGVFGTFLGIAIGLWGFDTANIDESIPILLKGLTTAFWTSILGIFFSIISQKFIQSIQYKNRSVASEDPILYLNDAIKNLTKSISSESEESVTTHLVKIRSLLTDELTPIKASLKKMENGIGGDGESSLLTQIQKMRLETGEQAKENQLIQSEQKDYLGSVSQKLSEVTLGNDQRNKTLTNLNDKLSQTHELMADNTTAISGKLDEFANLLEKANTEALVKAIENVIGGFNDRLNELIERLVKENFEELNNSVNSLNEWQRENKEQVEKLINQFKEVSSEFKISSETLEKTSEHTQTLVSEEGKLKQILIELDSVMTEDHKFKNAITQLNVTTTKLVKASDEVTSIFEVQESFSKQLQTLVATFDEQGGKVYEELVAMVDELEQSGELFTQISKNTEKIIGQESTMSKMVDEFERINTGESDFSKTIQQFKESAEGLKESALSMQESTKEVTSIFEVQEAFSKQLQNLVTTFEDQGGKVYEELNTMVEKLDQSSNLFERVAENTEKIIGQESSLSKMVDELDKINSVDSVFATSIESFSKTSEVLTKTSDKLDIWTDKHYDIVETTNSLVAALKEIESLRNNNQGLFNDIKQNFEEIAGILKGSNTELKNNFKDFELTFRTGLDQSFRSLDSILKEVVLGYADRLKAIERNRR